jgi:6-phosphogluconolactonase (cycloisomerase 2 family)
MPRGLQFSPDGKFLYSGNMLSKDITVFSVLENGILKDTNITIPAVSPSAIRFYTP